MEFLTNILTILLPPIMAIGGFFSGPAEVPPTIIQETVTITEKYDATDLNAQIDDLQLGAQNAIGGKRYSLSGSGVSASQTTIDLTNFDIAGSNTDLTMTHFGDLGCGTLEPGHTTRQEFISFTGVTQNSDDTAQLTGVTRGLLPVPDYSASTTFQSAHSGGSTFVVSNSPPCFFEDFASLSNDETITGSWTAGEPTASAGLATKNYVDANVSGGAVTQDGVAVGSTAGETFATGTIVFFDDQQDEWMKASAAVSASSTNVHLGISQGAGTNGAAISGGVLRLGFDETQTGMTAGQTLYLSDTPGVTSVSAGTNAIILGQSRTATAFYFDPIVMNIPYIAASNVWTGENTFTSATTTFDEKITGHASTTFTVYTANDTWTKPDYFEYIEVWTCGAGGGGGGTTQADEGASGGGGGGCAFENLSAAELSGTTSVTITIGAAGTAGAATGGTGGTGGTSKFDSFLSGVGGVGGTRDQALAGTGGIGTGGDLNIKGSGGETGFQDSSGPGGGGGDSHFGGGAPNVPDTSAGIDGGVFGGGGGGGNHNGGDATDRAGGAGAAGVAMITVHY